MCVFIITKWCAVEQLQIVLYDLFGKPLSIFPSLPITGPYAISLLSLTFFSDHLLFLSRSLFSHERRDMAHAQMHIACDSVDPEGHRYPRIEATSVISAAHPMHFSAV